MLDDDACLTLYICPRWPRPAVTTDGRVWSTVQRCWITPYVVNGYVATKYDRTTVYAHQLVADALIGPCPIGHEVDHKDTIRDHNHWTNLQYLTHAQNQRKGVAPKPPKRPRLKLSTDDVLAIRGLLATGMLRQVEIAQLFEVSKSCIHLIHHRKRRGTR